MVTLPRLVIAAPASGHGKTTVATGLMAALRQRGLTVSGHKVGPDYIDPSYHALATGRPGRNLDPYLQGEERVVPLLLHGAHAGRQAEVAVVEGVMGLFDGALGSEGYASTAHVARLIDAPVVLVIDASAAGRSAAAMVHGFATYDPRVRLAGVILNKLGSPRHETELRDAIEPLGVPVLGALHREDGIHAPSRHLGLVPVGERESEASAVLGRLRDWVAHGMDLDAVMRVAYQAPGVHGRPWDPAEQLEPVGNTGGVAGQNGVTVAAAAGQAFTFRYAENMELLRAAGVEVVDVDPLADQSLPPGCAGLYFGGGFPEVHVEALASNAALRAEIAAAVGRGVPVVAECAGLTYLCRELDGEPMTGVLDATATMTGRRTLGYRAATVASESFLAPAGARVTGHEFHRTQVTPRHGQRPAWRWQDSEEGFVTPTVHASYLHVHWAGHPALAYRFAAAAHARTLWLVSDHG
ncbi:cobyrinate a,c-diamide synthase [Haloechinothrix sp. LS1_15]|uniref:cobyrinate a,c-diamide synthase n=1 Tax=Haloechinothrix sp. LS1_15 TaxID=2652248 RepID=UPI002946F1B1|nr:cobyrinate a,c-diamide synthase [Haloechinothrix sp. LS1_15]MDV6013725.1 cobyrinate a,c-diamide synthase [Haloechinothrix sp. LS1_15]